MCFLCRHEGLFNADVKLSGAYSEPAPATGTQWFGLLNLLEAKKFTEETARCLLAAWRGRELHMINICDPHRLIMPDFNFR